MKANPLIKVLYSRAIVFRIPCEYINSEHSVIRFIAGANVDCPCVLHV